MLLAIDMGNTNIELGLMDGEELVISERISTDTKKTEMEYAVLIRTIFEIRGIRPSEITGAILSSVVPPLSSVIRRAVEIVTGIMPMIVGPGVKNGLQIRIDDPKALGADLVVAAVGAIALYGAPLIVIDMGTATTLDYIDEEGCFRGGAIIPGVNVSLNALVSGTSQLPKISLVAPKQAVATNTVTCMQSGIIYGQAAMIDGMIDRFLEESGSNARVVATGGLSKVIIPHCRHKIILDDELMIKGLKMIYDRNAHLAVTE